MSAPAPPGWYPDPQDSRGQRWWDGAGWTDHTGGGVTAPETGGPPAPVDTSMATVAHLSSIASAFIALAFLGPLIVYLMRPHDPFVRRHAAEALNFQLSMLLWGVVATILLVVFTVVAVGTQSIGAFTLPLVAIAALGVLWLVCVVQGALRASRGEEYRYPITIRFVS